MLVPSGRLNKWMKGEGVDIEFLNFAKSFDSVDHRLVMFSLQTNVMRSILPVLIMSFLSDCLFVVSVNSALSSPCDACSGFPRGAPSTYSDCCL